MCSARQEVALPPSEGPPGGEDSGALSAVFGAAPMRAAQMRLASGRLHSRVRGGHPNERSEDLRELGKETYWASRWQAAVAPR